MQRRVEQREVGAPVVAGRDLVKHYGEGQSAVRALDGVSLEVPAGRFISVMGPSGSGKSTLLHMLGGLDTPTSGEVLLEGKPLSALDDKARTLARRRTIGFVFQFFSLVPVLDAEENIALPAVIDGMKPSSYRARVQALLELVGLTDRRGNLPSQLSGGEQQRVAIARALLHEPALILADEPTGNLDSKTGLEVLSFLRRTQRELGQALVMVTHDPRAAAFADEALYLRDGRLVDRLSLDGLAEPAAAPRDGAGSGRTAAGSGTAPRDGAGTARTAAGSGTAPAAGARGRKAAAKGGDDRAHAVLSWLAELEA